MPSRCQDGTEAGGFNRESEYPSGVLDTLSASGQERLVTILDQYLIDIEEGRRVDVPVLLRQNPDLAGPLQHYLDGLQLVRELSLEAESDLLQSVPFGPTARLPVRGPFGADEPRSSSRLISSRLGPYELGEIIGRGAMGIVYRAIEPRNNRQVAVKVLAFGTVVEASRIDRFRREAQTAAALDHPNVVPVYAVGCEAGVNYYAMQLIEGASLDRRLQAARQLATGGERRSASATDNEGLAAPLQGPDRYRRIAQLGATAAGALDAAHRAGVIHRDVKPSNLVLGNDGQLWVTDFGLARVQAENGLTKTGELIGTVRYMSPEQASGHGDMIDARTDIYGLGATLYELVTGEAPFPGDDMLELLKRIQTSEPPSPQLHDAHIPRNLETIIRRAMRPRPSDRYPTAAAMAEDLRRFAAGQPILAHSVSLTERWMGWTLKHRRLAISLLALWVGVLAVSLVTSLLLLQAHARTTTALEKSEQHYRQARNIVDTLGSSVAQRLASIPAAESVREEILAKTIEYYDQFIADSARDPRLLHDVAQTRLEIARLTALAENYSQAEAAYQAVLKPYGLDHLRDVAVDSGDINSPSPPTSTAQTAPFSGSMAELFLCAQALNEWGLLASEHGRQEVARQRFDAALHCLATRSAGDLSEQHKLALAKALTHNNLGVVGLRLAQPSASARELQQAIKILQELPPEVLRTDKLGADVADAFSNLSVLLGEAELYTAATQAAEQSLAIRRQSQPTQVVEYQSRLAITYNNLAAYHWRDGRTEQAIDAYQQAAELLEQAIRKAPSRLDTRHRLAVTLNNLGMALVSQNTMHDQPVDNHLADKAERVFQRAAALAELAVTANPTDAEAVRRLASIQNNQAVQLRQQRRFAEAEQRLQNAAQLLQSLPPEESGAGQDTQLLQQIQKNRL